MADDIVLTQEEQVEQTKQWLKKNLPSIFIGLALGIALVYGYTNYKDSKIEKTAKASALFENILSSENPEEQAAEKVLEFKNDYSFTPYVAKIALLNAKHLVQQGNISGAIEEYQWIESNSTEELVASVAKLRQAELLVSEGMYDQAEKIISETPPVGFESNYFELKGDVAAAKNDYELAKQHYDEALKNANPQLGYSTYLLFKINNINSLSKSKS